MKRYLLAYNVMLLSVFFGCNDIKKPEAAESRIIAAQADSLIMEAKSLGRKERIKSRFLADSALKMALSVGNKAIEAKCYNQLGRLFFEGRQLDSALHYHRRALDIRRNLRDTQAMGYSYTNIGVVLCEYGLWKRSANYNDSAIWAFEQVKDTFQYLRRLQSKGIIAVELEGDSSALEVFLDYERRSRAYGEDILAVEACRSISLCYYALQKPDSSIYWLNRSWELCARLNDSAMMMNLKMDLAVRYFGLPDLNRGTQFLNESEQLLNHGFGSALDSLYLKEAKFIQKLALAGQDSLIQYFEQCFVAEEAYYNRIHASQLSEVEGAYELNAKQAQNQALYLQNQQYKIRFMRLLLLFLGLVVILVLTISYYRTKRRNNIREMELKERHILNVLQEQELKTVNAALEGKDQERTRIAGELHDRLGYILALAKLNFSSLQEDLSRMQHENSDRFSRISEMLDEASAEVRRISHDLYGSSVFNFGITTALHQLAEAFSAANKIQVRFHSQYVPSDLRLELQVSVYRIIGELISNTLKHAKAAQIDIQLFGRAGELVLTYEDDGKGFDADDASWRRGIGYANIEARLKKYNGTYLVETAPGKGMYFQAEIPSIYQEPSAL
jgi:signal transduction histidine kinase